MNIFKEFRIFVGVHYIFKCLNPSLNTNWLLPKSMLIEEIKVLLLNISSKLFSQLPEEG